MIQSVQAQLSSNNLYSLTVDIHPGLPFDELIATPLIRQSMRS